MFRKLLALAAITLSAPASAAVFTLCAEAWQPFIYQNAQGQPVGLAVDALGRAARAEGHRIRYLFLAPASCLRLMKEQRIDIMAFATAEGSPPGWLQTQQPLVYWVLNAWVRADNPLHHYSGLGHFSAHKVAFVDVYDYPPAIAAKRDWQRVAANDSTTAVRQLAAGRVDVIFEDAVALQDVDPSLHGKIRRLQPVVASVAQPFSFRPGLELLRDAVDGEAQRLKGSGELDRFYQRHFGSTLAQVSASVAASP